MSCPHNVTMPEMATHSAPGPGGTYPPPHVSDYDGKNAPYYFVACQYSHSCEPGSPGVTTITYLSIDTGY